MATTKEQQIYQAIWRKAIEIPEGLTIPTPSERSAKSLRFALYNASRRVRNGQEVADAVLTKAVQEIAISFTPDKMGLRLCRKEATGLLPQLVEIVGEANVVSTEDKLAAESADRIAGLLTEAAPAEAPSANPYYTR